MAIVVSLSLERQATRREIDPVAVSPDMYHVRLENEHVRVIEYVIKRGERDQWHTHPPKVSYIIAGGSLRITVESIETLVVDEKAGEARWMDHVGKHLAGNVGETPVRVPLVEVKAAG